MTTLDKSKAAIGDENLIGLMAVNRKLIAKPTRKQSKIVGVY